MLISMSILFFLFTFIELFVNDFANKYWNLIAMETSATAVTTPLR